MPSTLRPPLQDRLRHAVLVLLIAVTASASWTAVTGIAPWEGRGVDLGRPELAVGHDCAADGRWVNCAYRKAMRVRRCRQAGGPATRYACWRQDAVPAS